MQEICLVGGTLVSINSALFHSPIADSFKQVYFQSNK